MIGSTFESQEFWFRCIGSGEAVFECKNIQHYVRVAHNTVLFIIPPEPKCLPTLQVSNASWVPTHLGCKMCIYVLPSQLTAHPICLLDLRVLLWRALRCALASTQNKFMAALHSHNASLDNSFFSRCDNERFKLFSWKELIKLERKLLLLGQVCQIFHTRGFQFCGW